LGEIKNKENSKDLDDFSGKNYCNGGRKGWFRRGQDKQQKEMTTGETVTGVLQRKCRPEPSAIPKKGKERENLLAENGPPDLKQKPHGSQLENTNSQRRRLQAKKGQPLNSSPKKGRKTLVHHPLICHRNQRREGTAHPEPKRAPREVASRTQKSQSPDRETTT